MASPALCLHAPNPTCQHLVMLWSRVVLHFQMQLTILRGRGATQRPFPLFHRTLVCSNSEETHLYLVTLPLEYCKLKLLLKRSLSRTSSICFILSFNCYKVSVLMTEFFPKVRTKADPNIPFSMVRYCVKVLLVKGFLLVECVFQMIPSCIHDLWLCCLYLEPVSGFGCLCEYGQSLAGDAAW